MWIVNVNLGVSCYLSAEAFLKGRSAPKRPSSEPPQRIGIGQLLPAMELDLFWLIADRSPRPDLFRRSQGEYPDSNGPMRYYLPFIYTSS